MTMWIKYLRFVPDDGIAIRELGRQAALSNQEMKIWLTRLSKWWGYLVIDKPAGQNPLDCIIRPTPGGLKALQVGRPLIGLIEERWRERCGEATIDGLRRTLQTLVDQLDPDLPDYLPILGYDMLSRVTKRENQPAGQHALPILLAKVLLAFAIRYENKSGLSLAISANVLRLAGEGGTRIRDLPRLSGVSKEAIAMAVKRLEERGFATVQAESKDSRLKTLRLATKGQQARDDYERFVRGIEDHWTATFGRTVSDLRSSLEALGSLLFKGLEPYPDGWRASLPKVNVLPHYPVILHRGGFPDGS